MATALDVLNVARTQIGFHEGVNNSNPYGIWYGVPNAPYCAMGVSWCFAQVGLSHLIAAQTVKGAAQLLLLKNTHPEQEIDKVTTPKGCTIAGLNEMEHQGFSSSLIKGIITSYKKILSDM